LKSPTHNLHVAMMATAGFACLLEFFPGRQFIGWLGQVEG
jgi:hypothetical protein